MYDLINKHAVKIVGAAESGLVPYYEWLRQYPTSQTYERDYKNFWAMGQARPSDRFCVRYFDLLRGIRSGPLHPDPILQLAEVARELYHASEDCRGRKTVQFSFATKLMHTARPHLPIYDSLVAEFYFFQGPKQKETELRIAEYTTFYRFLMSEYKRILDQGLLAPAIELFRSKCTPALWTDEKIIDSLIWAFVASLRKREIKYV